jgi:hypothetical protein
MNDMSQVIIPKSDQISADDFIAGPITYRIDSVEIRAGTEQPVSIHLAGEPRAWKPCKSMSRVLVAAWGPDANVYKGRSVTLYRDPTVKWGGMEIGGIRVSHMSHIERDMLLQLTATKGKRAPHIVKPITGDTGAKQLTIDDARTAITQAASLDDLKKVWSAKTMAPFRDELQDALDERKAALAFEHAQEATETVTPETDPAQAKADEIIAAAAKCEVIADLNNVKDDYALDIEAMPDALLPLVAGAINGAEARLKGK